MFHMPFPFGPDIADTLAALRTEGDGFIWLGMHEPTFDELTEVADKFKLHPLAVEDAVKAHQRPKVEAHGDVATTRAALKGGAFDFIEKPFDDTLLLDTIRAASQVSVERRTRAERDARFAQTIGRLTPREREVLDQVLAGKHNREIAALLSISPRTVEVYKARLMDKLDVDRLPDLIRLALEMGLGDLTRGRKDAGR